MEEPRGLKLTGTNRSIGLIDRRSCMATTASPAHRSRQYSNAVEQTMSRSCLHTRVFRVRLADLVAMPGGPHPIPSRTQSLSPPGPMVLRLKAWESRSLPGLHDAHAKHSPRTLNHNGGFGRDVLGRGLFAAVCVSGAKFDAGWSSPVARQAHNLKVVGSNPTPAPKSKRPRRRRRGLFVVRRFRTSRSESTGRACARFQSLRRARPERSSQTVAVRSQRIVQRIRF